MEKHEEIAFEILDRLEEMFIAEYSDAEGELMTGKICEPFFIGCFMSLAMLFDRMVDTEINLLEFTHICNRWVVHAMVDKIKKEMGEKKCPERES